MNAAGKQMHIVRFMGGLANQIFQLCLYHRLQEEYGEEQVYADLSIFIRYHDHGGYKLDKWFDLNECKTLPESYEVVGEDDFFDEKKRSAKNVLYNGYWQDIVFFPKDISFLDKIMDPSFLNEENKKLYERICSSSSVSVHVRRGDYLDNHLHGNIANVQFIDNAIGYIKDVVKDPVFFVFSNDPDWCEKHINIEDAECHIVRGNESAVELDITMMSACKHNIIANSSFSWWAQYLNKNPEKIVIAPEYWFNQKMSGNRLNLESFVHVKNVPSIDEPVEKPYFSVLIPVYNKEDCLRRAMSSVLNQSYSDIEVIVVDDGSKDGSYRLLQEYAKNDKRIKLIRNEKNSSLLVSRIVAMREAKGEYILFLDSDDYCSGDLCRVLRQKLEKKAVDILEYAFMRQPEKTPVRADFVFDADYLKKIISREITHTVWNKCYSRSLVRKVLEQVEEFYCNMSEDTYFSALFAAYAKSYDRTDEILYHYVVEGGMTDSCWITEDKVRKDTQSVLNRKNALTAFLQKNRPELLPEFEKGELLEMKQYAWLYLGMPVSIYKKLTYLAILDEAFGTDFEKRYGNYVEHALNIYEDYKLNGRKHKVKLAGRLMLKTLRNLKKKNEPMDLF